MISIPLAPSLVLGLLSFLSSGFVLCRILIPIFPPGPCYRRAPSKKLGLSSADISHAWLSIFDTISLIAFLVQVFYQYQTDTLSFDASKHGDSAALLWLALTARQTCLLIVLTITLTNVRLGRSTYFGSKQIYLWFSTIAMVGTGVIAAALLSIFGFTSLFGGIAVYLSVVTILAVSILGFLVTTLWRIKRNLEKDREAQDIDSWPIPPRNQRTSFTTDEVHAIKDGASWITSIEGSARRSLSPWSFAASQTNHPKSKHVARHSMPTSFYSLTTGSIVSEINAMKREQEHIPPVPPLPSPYKKTTQVQADAETSEDVTPTSWLTSLSGAKTMSPFSFPTTRAPSLKTIASRLTGRRGKDTQPNTGTTAVFPVSFAIEPKRLPNTSTTPLRSLAVTSAPTNHIVTTPRVIIWLAMICLPFMLTMPYLILARSDYDYQSSIPGILLAIAQAIPSPLLALSILLKIRLPIPSNLFVNKPRHVKRKSTAATTALPLHRHSTELRVRGKSGSYTVIEGRRGGDVWISQGQAVDGLSKAGRVMSLLAPNPRLAVLPLHNKDSFSNAIKYDKPIRPHSSQIQVSTMSTDEDVDEVALVPQHARHTYATDSSPSLATAEDSPVSQFQVMTARRYQPFPARILQFTGGCRVSRGPPLSPPPATPLPPRPDEYLEEGSSTSPNRIDSLAAGMLPILVPGLTVSENQQITPYRGYIEGSPPSTGSSDRSREHCRREVLDMIIETPRAPRRVRSNHSILTPPDDHSTPRFRFPKHNLDHHSLPPLPGNSNVMYQPAKVNRSTPASDMAGQGNSPLDSYNISLVPEDDTLSRKLNSLIRSLGTPGTPSSPRDGLPPNRSPVKPLVPRRTGGTTRHKSRSQRFSSLGGARRSSPSKKPLPRRPRDSKVLYKVSSSRTLRASPPKQASPEKRASPAEYIPAVNRLSAIITNYELNKKQTTINEDNDLSASKASYSNVPHKSFGDKHNSSDVSFLGEFAQIGPLIDGKENAPVRSASTAPLSRTDTAKHRTMLIQSQQLPTVRVRPPSGGSFQAFAPTRAKSSWRADMI